MYGNFIEQSVLDELVEGIIAIIPKGIASIILYGSVARGTAEWDSDVDIAILVERPFTKEEFDKLADFVVDMDLKYDKVFSVIDIEYEKFKKWLKAIPFYRNVEKEGIVLWKAA